LVTEGYIPLKHLITLQRKYSDLNLSLVSFPKFSEVEFSANVFSNTVSVAFIAILETLISARIADDMTKTKHDQGREVLSIAICNIVTGVLGGIPATAALARTALNVKSGATSRVSGVINAFAILLISLALLPLFKFIPMPTVAALLVMVAVRMVAVDHLTHMWLYDKKSFIVAMLSAIFCIIIDTMAGIIVGAVISILMFVDNMATGHSEVQVVNQHKHAVGELDNHTVDEDEQLEGESVLPYTSFYDEETAETEELYGEHLVYHIIGQLTFVNGSQHINRATKLAKDKDLKTVILSLRYLHYADIDGVDALKEVVNIFERKNIQILFSGVVRGGLMDSLSRHNFFAKKVNEGFVYSTHEEALNHITTEEA
jgi:SulP family sulfate permease